ncbi:penicillin acylase family protein [Pseudomonas citri]|uniref:penicillin acylase family protein n=1 Tax=Pseudomonas citri TaxID=2978349 RepID=UPI0036F1A117
MKRIAQGLLVLLLVAVAGGTWYVYSKQPQRQGVQPLAGLQAPVTLRYDERGIPHINASNQDDLYRALGYAQAQERLFQMEMLRRLARGELAQVLGSKLVPTDKLFRTLRIRDQADRQAAQADHNSPAWQALQAYLEGINEYQRQNPSPMEFDLLGIPKRSFTPEDVYSIVGYMAYSFAAAFRTEPLLTYVRDDLGAPYLEIFDRQWRPDGTLQAQAFSAADWKSLDSLAQLSQQAVSAAGLPQLEGSNAWAISGTRTAGGKPLLAGDPHIRFSVPSVWYEAHLSAPGFELYGDYQSLVPFALLGHNSQFAWTLTMFQNDDIDLIAEKTHPDDPEQIWYQGRWVHLEEEQARIDVKDAPPVYLRLRRSPHGPIINDALGDNAGSRPIALWWAYLNTDNPIVEAFYGLNRADTLDKARAAAAKIQAPGLNVVYANASGDIAWWACAALPIRPPKADPGFILDGSGDEAQKSGYYPVSDNPHEENPARGYIVSANTQPPSANGVPIPGYYNLPDRGQRLNQLLGEGEKWDVEKSRQVQLDTRTLYAQRVLQPLLPTLRGHVTDPQQRRWLDALGQWQGDYPLDSVSATVFNQFLYQLAYQVLHDELGDGRFENLLSTRVLDAALPRLAENPQSPWWDDRTTAARETRDDIVARAWSASIAHLQATLGNDPSQWQWGKAHRLTQMHPLGTQKWLGMLFNVGPMDVPGNHEVPDNFSSPLGPAPWTVTYGPSVRRLIDLNAPEQALGMLPVGQSGVLLDRHYKDQALPFTQGQYQPMHLAESDIARHTRSTLELVPAVRSR